jgi:hypothetical protein
LLLSVDVNPGSLSFVSQPRGISTNRILAAAATLLWLCRPLASGVLADSTVDEQVKTIRSRYDAVEKDLSRCKQVKRDLPDESTEGGELTAYFSDQSLRKLAAKFYGETGQSREEYYFWDDRLFFVMRVQSRYDKMFGKVVSKKEERFYFAGDALIRWLDTLKKEAPAGAEFQERGRDYLARAKKYSAMVRE